MDKITVSPESLIETLTFVAFDVETTGLNSKEHEIVECGAVKFSLDGELEEFSSLCKPTKGISKEAQEVNKISDDELAKAPEITEVLPKFLAFQEGCVLVAHNLRFDLGFIQESSLRLGYSFTPLRYFVDTLALSRRLIRGVRYSLSALCAHFGITLVNSHRALDDARACKELLLKCIEKKQIMGMLSLKELLV